MGLLSGLALCCAACNRSLPPAVPPREPPPLSQKAAVRSWTMNGEAAKDSLRFRPGQQIEIEVELGDFRLDRETTLTVSGKVRPWSPSRDSLDIWICFGREGNYDWRREPNAVCGLNRVLRTPKGVYRYVARNTLAPTRSGEYDLQLKLHQRVANDFHPDRMTSGEVLAVARVKIAEESEN